MIKVINKHYFPPQQLNYYLFEIFYSTRVRQYILVSIDYFSLFFKDLAFVEK